MKRSVLAWLSLTILLIGACTPAEETEGDSTTTEPEVVTTVVTTETTAAEEDGGSTTVVREPEGTGELIVVGAGGTYFRGLQLGYLEPFASATGIDVQLVEGGDDPIAQIQAQIDAGNVLWDVVVCGPTTELTFPELWEPIDLSIITSTDDFAVEDALGERRALLDLEAFPAIAYRTDIFESGGPGSWADFYDTTNFPGPRGVPDLGLDSAWALPATALLADGVSSAELVPFDLDRAYVRLEELRPDIRAFYSGYTAAQDLLRSGEIVMGMMTDGRGIQLINAGEPVAVVFNESFLYKGSLCTPAGSPNSQNAMLLYEYIYSHPEQQAVFSAITTYGPPTVTGAELLVETGVTEFSTNYIDQLIPDSDELLTYIQENSEELLDRYNEWLQGG